MFTVVMMLVIAFMCAGLTPSSRSCEDGISRKHEAQCSRIVRKPPPAWSFPLAVRHAIMRKEQPDGLTSFSYPHFRSPVKQSPASSTAV